jgi:hypothetical protein
LQITFRAQAHLRAELRDAKAAQRRIDERGIQGRRPFLVELLARIIVEVARVELRVLVRI